MDDNITIGRITYNLGTESLFGSEGGLSNHPNDRGGLTNFGITQRTLQNAQRLGLVDDNITDVRSITPTIADTIYYNMYWSNPRLHLNDIASVNPGLAIAIFDMTVNSGPTAAAEALQSVLGVNVDGNIGPITLNAISNYESETGLFDDYLDQRQDFYNSIIENDSTQAIFAIGWTNRLINLENFVDERVPELDSIFDNSSAENSLYDNIINGLDIPDTPVEPENNDLTVVGDSEGGLTEDNIVVETDENGNPYTSLPVNNSNSSLSMFNPDTINYTDMPTHKITENHTLSDVSSQTHIPESALLAYNQIDSIDDLPAGQSLAVPFIVDVHTDDNGSTVMIFAERDGSVKTMTEQADGTRVSEYYNSEDASFTTTEFDPTTGSVVQTHTAEDGTVSTNRETHNQINNSFDYSQTETETQAETNAQTMEPTAGEMVSGEISQEPIVTESWTPEEPSIGFNDTPPPQTEAEIFASMSEEDQQTYIAAVQTQVFDLLKAISNDPSLLNDDLLNSFKDSPVSSLILKRQLKDLGFTDVDSMIDEDGNITSDTGLKRIVYEATEDATAGVQISHTVAGQISSLINRNNDFNDLESFAVDVTVSTVVENIAETFNGNEAAWENISDELGNTAGSMLRGAAISLVVSEYFESNDSLSEMLNIQSDSLGGVVDLIATQYATQVVSAGFSSVSVSMGWTAPPVSSATSPYSFEIANFAGAVGSYAGSTLAYEHADFIDTENEAIGASVGSAVGAAIAMALITTAAPWLLLAGSAAASYIGVFVGGIIGGLFGGSTPPPMLAQANYDFDAETGLYSLGSSSSSNGGSQEAMESIAGSLANHYNNMIQIAGGQLSNVDALQAISVNQVNSRVTINGRSTTFSGAQGLVNTIVGEELPFIQVEDGDPYVLRAMHRTNEEHPGDVTELYDNIQLAQEYSNYQNSTQVVLDANGKPITDPEIFAAMSDEYTAMMQEEDPAVRAQLQADFQANYSFTTQDAYVDNLMATVTALDIQTYHDNRDALEAEHDALIAIQQAKIPMFWGFIMSLEEKNQLEAELETLKLAKEEALADFDIDNFAVIDFEHWEEVFEIAETLSLDEHHYSEDYNRLNTAISDFNYEQRELNGELLDLDNIVTDVLNAFGEQYKDGDESVLAYIKELGGKVDEKTGHVSIDQDVNVEYSGARLDELIALSGIDNPYADVSEDAFSFAGKSINDLQMELVDGKLVITTFDKDLSPEEAAQASQTFVIEDWESWDKEHSHLELPNGSRLNLANIIETFGIVDGGGLVDLNEAGLALLAEDETLEDYLAQVEANNSYVGTSGDDIITAFFNDNLIVAGEGDDTIRTGAGDDILIGGAGADTLEGGMGSDTASYVNATNGVAASLSDGGLSGDAAGDSYEDIENLTGSAFDDYLVGDSGDNVLDGGAGDDLLVGGAGADTLIGGEGFDTASYRDSESFVEINLNNGQTAGDAEGDTFESIESIDASRFNDILVGNTENNIFYANEGDDRISAGAGDDTIIAGEGDDLVKGDEGNDVLYGNEGDDTLLGGEGNDLLVGGTGHNTLMGGSGTDMAQYAGDSTDYQIVFRGSRLLVQSKDGSVKDVLMEVEQIAFDDAIFAVDYENGMIVKIALLKDPNIAVETTQEAVNNVVEESSAASIATAVALGALVTPETAESSTDEITFFDNTVEGEAPVEATTIVADETTVADTTSEVVIVSEEITQENSLIQSSSSQSLPVIESAVADEAVLETTVEESSSNSGSSAPETVVVETTENVVLDTVIEDSTAIEEVPVVEEVIVATTSSSSDDEPEALIDPIVTMNNVVTLEDNSILLNLQVQNPNPDTFLDIVLAGIPDDAVLSAGTKESNGNWTVELNDLVDLRVLPGLHNGDDFTIEVHAMVNDGMNRAVDTIKNQVVTVVAVADTPELTVDANALGNEDTQISLDMSSFLVDRDGSESLNIKISGVPDGAVLNHGSKDADGIWHLTPSELAFLTVTPTEHDAVDFTITVDAYTTEAENGDVAVISKDIDVTVTAVADSVELDLFQNLSGQDNVIVSGEDASITLLDISSKFIDLDGSESVHYIIEGFPTGVVVNNGELLDDGSWKVLPDGLTGLGFNLVENSDEDFTIKVTAVTTEAENGDEEFTSEFIDVQVQSIADFANLQMSNARGIENNYIALDIQSSLMDNDGSESLSIVIENVPVGAKLTKGVVDADGIWHLDPADLSGLMILPAEGSLGSFELVVKAISTEAKNDDSNEVIQRLAVTVDPIPTNAGVTVSVARANEDEVCLLDITVDQSELRESESMYLRLELADGFSLNQGTMSGTNSWKLLPEDLVGLELLSPQNFAGTMVLSIDSVIVEANGTQRVTTAAASLAVDIIPVADDVTLSTQDVTVSEDKMIDLNISAKLNDLDGSETHEVYLSNFPVGSIFNVGTQIGNEWVVNGEDIETLKMIPTQDISGSFNISVRAVATDSNGDASEVTQNISLIINAVADTPILNISDAYIKDGQSFLAIDSFLHDSDGSETLEINISNLPNNTMLSAGTLNGDGSYTLTQAELADLTLDGLNGDSAIRVTAISRETNGSESSVSKDMVLSAYDETLPFISLNRLVVSSSTQDGDILNTTNANENIFSGGGNDVINAKGGNDTILSDASNGTISISSFLDVSTFKQDGSEDLYIEISGLPTGYSANVGYDNNGVLVIEGASFDGNLILNYPYQSQSLDITVNAFAESTNPLDPYTLENNLTFTIDGPDKSGNDFVDAGLGNDIVDGGAGDDILIGNSGNDQLVGSSGDDYIVGSLGSDRLFGGSGNDTLVIDADDLILTAADFAIFDRVDGGSGYDTVVVEGTAGVNFNMGLTQTENFTGSLGNDTVIGSVNSDTIRGNAGADVYITLEGDDVIYIDDADVQAQGSSFIDMGSGYDKIYVESTTGVSFDISGTNAEEIIASEGNDVFTNSGNDRIKIFANGGDDTIYASSSIDMMDGGSGSDTIDYSNSNAGVIVNLTTNVANGGYAQNDILTNFENVVGTAFNDALTGDSGDNSFKSGSGNDTINGVSGYDLFSIDESILNYYNGSGLHNIARLGNERANITSLDGTVDSLNNINEVAFSDFTVYLDRNNAAYAIADSVATAEDVSTTISAGTLLANDFDIEGDSFTITSVQNSRNGTVVLNPDGTITFTPNKDYNSSINNTFDKESALYRGEAGFEYSVTDANGDERTAFVSVDVSAVNDVATIDRSYFYRTGIVSGHGRLMMSDVDSDITSMNIDVVSSLNIYDGRWYIGTGRTNISGRSFNQDGIFDYDYIGVDTSKWAEDYELMRTFLVNISDDGDPLTGANIQSTTISTGMYVHDVWSDPVVLDLDGDGVEIENRYYEALGGDFLGVNQDDAMLVWDRDGDGRISQFLETSWVSLSDTATNDFDVLREIFDTNSDGSFDKEDEAWTDFAMWQDHNSDGLVTDDEFTYLVDSNVQSLDLTTDESKIADMPIDEYASFVTTDGGIHEMAAAFLDINATEDKLSLEDIEVMKEAAILNEQLAASMYEDVEIANYATVIDAMDSSSFDEIDEENIA